MLSLVRRSRVPGAVLCMITAGMLLLGPSALAAEVFRFTDDFDRTQGDGDGDTDCGADGVNDYSIDLDGRVTLILSDDATVRVHVNWDGSAWVEGGESVRFHHALTVTERPDGSSTITGLGYGQFGDPGGPSVMDAGLIRIDDSGVFLAGPKQLLEHFGLDPNAATCASLGL